MCAVAGTVLAGCGRLGSPIDALGGDRPAPDEFRVVTRKPLNMPASINLPEPRPGERSPLEYDPHGDAAIALTGKRIATGATEAGPGEAALLAATNANANNAAVNTRLVAAEAAATANKPYVPPTVLEMLNLGGQSEKEILDPNAEARRLQSDGVAAAPVNPADRPAPAATDDDYVSPGEQFDPAFPYGNQQKRGRP